jgi:hypothetical protein
MERPDKQKPDRNNDKDTQNWFEFVVQIYTPNE